MNANTIITPRQRLLQEAYKMPLLLKKTEQGAVAYDFNAKLCAAWLGIELTSDSLELTEAQLKHIENVAADSENLTYLHGWLHITEVQIVCPKSILSVKPHSVFRTKGYDDSFSKGNIYKLWDIVINEENEIGVVINMWHDSDQTEELRTDNGVWCYCQMRPATMQEIQLYRPDLLPNISKN